MAQNITLLGAAYSDVPSVLLPKTGGGTAQFDDTTIASNAAAASDITNGKMAYVNGSLVTGTNSGGGGTDHLTKIATKSLGTISTSSTSAADTGQTLQITADDYKNYDMLVAVCHTSPHTNGRHIATVRLINMSATSTLTTKTATQIATSTQHWKLNSSGTLQMRSGTTPYGVYVNAATLDTSSNPNKITFTIYQRYNSTSTGTINGSYVLDVYGVKLQDLL